MVSGMSFVVVASSSGSVIDVALLRQFTFSLSQLSESCYIISLC